MYERIYNIMYHIIYYMSLNGEVVTMTMMYSEHSFNERFSFRLSVVDVPCAIVSWARDKPQLNFVNSSKWIFRRVNNWILTLRYGLRLAYDYRKSPVIRVTPQFIYSRYLISIIDIFTCCSSWIAPFFFKIPVNYITLHI